MPKVFISYVRENLNQVKKLAGDLKKLGAEVWIDFDVLLPGDRWKERIRTGIEEGDFFLACFSAEYQARNRTYMNEEIVFAIEILRQQHFAHRWFIPVLLTETEVPAIDIGGGSSLRDLQWAKLYDGWEIGVESISKSMGLLEGYLDEREQYDNPYFELMSRQSGIAYDSISFDGAIGEDGSVSVRREISVVAYSLIEFLDGPLVGIQDRTPTKTIDTRYIPYEHMGSKTLSALVMNESTELLVEQSKSEYTLRLRISPPLHNGDRITYQLIQRSREPIYLGVPESTDPDFFGYRVSKPTRYISCSIVLAPGFRAKKYWANVLVTNDRGKPSLNQSLVNSEVERCNSPSMLLEDMDTRRLQTLTLNVKYPLPGLTYMIEWF